MECLISNWEMLATRGVQEHVSVNLVTFANFLISSAKGL